MNPATVHTYIRCVNKIYVGDASDNWRELHCFETENRAKRWQRDQEKKRPGSVTVGNTPPQVTRAKIEALKADYARRRVDEIRKLVREQEADRRRSEFHRAGMGTLALHEKVMSLSGKTARLAHPYVAPDHDGSSFSRGPSKRRTPSRNAKNTRANYGGM